MQEKKSREVWLTGPVDGITPLLQPAAHALLQAVRELSQVMQDFPQHLLWKRPADLASPGFHLQHLSGVLDRLFTYASGVMLSEEQLQTLRSEGVAAENVTAGSLVEAFNRQVQKSIDRLKHINEDELKQERKVGRAGLPSTVLGLIMHAAEHTMRHVGQLLVTVTVLKYYDEAVFHK